MNWRYAFLLAGLTWTMFSCNQPPKPKEEVDTEIKIDADTISQETFDQWTAAWDSLGANYSDTLLVRYYNMRLVNLVAVLGEKAEGVRFYQGLEEVSPGNWIAHLIAVGTDANRQIIPKYFDYTTPCPPSCE